MKLFRLDIPAHITEIIWHFPPELKGHIKSAFRHINENSESGTPLVKELEGYWRYRVKRFRIVYSIDTRQRILRVVAIGHRRRIYEEVAALFHEK